MAQACPQCGDANARRSALHSSDGLSHILLFTCYRCRACRFRFCRVSPIKPVVLAGLLALALFSGWWLASDNHARDSALSVETAYSQITARANHGDPDAELQMGLRYAEGNGVIKNEKEAARWFEKAARHNIAEAQYRYGLALLDGHGVVQDYKAAFHWIELPAKKGHSLAQYKLGELYRYGTGIETDKPRAYLWFNLAAAQGVDIAAKARDSLVWQLKPDQISAMQTEAKRISLGNPESPLINPPPAK